MREPEIAGRGGHHCKYHTIPHASTATTMMHAGTTMLSSTSHARILTAVMQTSVGEPKSPTLVQNGVTRRSLQELPPTRSAPPRRSESSHPWRRASPSRPYASRSDTLALKVGARSLRKRSLQLRDHSIRVRAVLRDSGLASLAASVNRCHLDCHMLSLHDSVQMSTIDPVQHPDDRERQQQPEGGACSQC